jgi:hypothetical protein
MPNAKEGSGIGSKELELELEATGRKKHQVPTTSNKQQAPTRN